MADKVDRYEILDELGQGGFAISASRVPRTLTTRLQNLLKSASARRSCPADQASRRGSALRPCARSDPSRLEAGQHSLG